MGASTFNNSVYCCCTRYINVEILERIRLDNAILGLLLISPLIVCLIWAVAMLLLDVFEVRKGFRRTIVNVIGMADMFFHLAYIGLIPLMFIALLWGVVLLVGI